MLQMVVYEAARSLVNLKNMKSKDLCSAVSGGLFHSAHFLSFSFDLDLQLHCLSWEEDLLKIIKISVTISAFFASFISYCPVMDN